jgi:single-stranded DNA-binding protein
MSIDALITGRLVGQPQQRTSKNGKPFTTCKARIPTGDDSLFCNVICFDQATQAALLALDGGEAVSLAGELKVGIWQANDGTTRPSLDMTAHALLTTHHVRRKRQAMQPEQDGRHEQRPSHAAWQAAAPAGRARHAPAADGLDDGAPLDF